MKGESVITNSWAVGFQNILDIAKSLTHDPVCNDTGDIKGSTLSSWFLSIL